MRKQWIPGPIFRTGSDISNGPELGLGTRLYMHACMQLTDGCQELLPFLQHASFLLLELFFLCFRLQWLFGLMWVFGTPTVHEASTPSSSSLPYSTHSFVSRYLEKKIKSVGSKYSAVERRHQGNLQNHQLLCNCLYFIYNEIKLYGSPVGAFCSPIEHVQWIFSEDNWRFMNGIISPH